MQEILTINLIIFFCFFWFILLYVLIQNGCIDLCRLWFVRINARWRHRNEEELREAYEFALQTLQTRMAEEMPIYSPTTVYVGTGYTQIEYGQEARTSREF